MAAYCDWRSRALWSRIRIDRHWVPRPPPRRFVTRLELEPVDDEQYRTGSNFPLFYSHNGAENHACTGRRRDGLRRVDGPFTLCQRKVIIDGDITTEPTMALIF